MPPNIISSLLSTIVAAKKYIELKDAVLTRHEWTKPEMFKKLLTEKQMIGKPSAFLHELLSIANNVGVKDELICHKFIQALPSEVRLVIAAVKNATLIELGTLADEIMPFAKPKRVYHAAIPNTTRYTRPTGAIPRTTYNTGPFYENQKLLICHGHLHYAERSRTCKLWYRWPNKSGCKVIPSSRTSSPIRHVIHHKPENYKCELH